MEKFIFVFQLAYIMMDSYTVHLGQMVNISLIEIQVESAPYVYILIRSVFSNISAQPFLFYCYCLH